MQWKGVALTMITVFLLYAKLWVVSFEVLLELR